MTPCLFVRRLEWATPPAAQGCEANADAVSDDDGTGDHRRDFGSHRVLTADSYARTVGLIGRLPTIPPTTPMKAPIADATPILSGAPLM